jgi:hypothetical protein
MVSSYASIESLPVGALGATFAQREAFNIVVAAPSSATAPLGTVLEFKPL